MFGLIKKVFITLLSFSGSLGRVAKISDRIKFISLNNEHAQLDLQLLI